MNKLIILHILLLVSGTLTSQNLPVETDNYWYDKTFISLATSYETISSCEDTSIDYLDTNQPLGPNAQSLRNSTYSCPSETSHLEKGLWIKLGDKLFQYKDQNLLILNSKNKLVNIGFYVINKVLMKTLKTLRRLENESAYARNIILTLQHSDNKFVISIVNTRDSYLLVPLPDNRLGALNNNAYAFQAIERESLIVSYAPFNKIGSGAEIRWAPKHTMIKLAHELSHAYDANYGLLNDQLIKENGEIVSVREIRAQYHENIIRKEINMHLRNIDNPKEMLISEEHSDSYFLPVSAGY